MGKRLKSIATLESEFQYGIDSRQVIADTQNVKGELWLYVNRHPDNNDLLKALFKLKPCPSVYSRGRKKKVTVFGYEFIFKQGTKAVLDIRKSGFKVA